MDLRVSSVSPTLYLLLVILAQLLSFVSCEGEFSIRIKFDTRVERDISGFCCSGVSHTNNDSCSSECSLRMRVCLKEYQSHIEPNSICTYGVRETSSIEQPLTFPFSFAWPGYFTIIVEAWNSPNSDLPHSDLTDKLVLRMSEAKSVEVGNNWVSERHSSGDLWFSVEYRVTCALNYYGKSCMQFCKPRDNQWGHFQCSSQGLKSCLQGWKGPNCDKPVCLPGCNTKHGSCSVPNECMCLEGWTGDKCDLCQRYPGCMEGSCESPWQCLCNEGWGGIFCNQDLNYCTHHQPCENQATCTNSGQGHYTCTCIPGFTGTNCERKIGDCSESPCLNGGSCMEDNLNYTCACPSGFQGRHCQISGSSCSDNPCENGASCIQEYAQGYSCVCGPDWEGPNCDVPLNYCDSDPCQNGGRCIESGSGFKCICAVGFEGDECEINRDDCPKSACLNGGTCVDGVNAFQCHCSPGFTGILCQNSQPHCLRNPCANGAKCTDFHNDFRCECPTGFRGKDCSLPIYSCVCANGGTCVQGECICPACFSGSACSIANQQCLSSMHSTSNLSSIGTTGLISISIIASVIILFMVVLIFCVCLWRRRKLSADYQNDINDRKANNFVHNHFERPEIHRSVPMIAPVKPFSVCDKVNNTKIDNLPKTFDEIHIKIEPAKLYDVNCYNEMSEKLKLDGLKDSKLCKTRNERLSPPLKANFSSARLGDANRVPIDSKLRKQFHNHARRNHDANSHCVVDLNTQV